MLRPISDHDTDTRFAAMFRGWQALDLDNGAYLIVSYGRSRVGSPPKWTLIVKGKHDTLKAMTETFDFKYRSFIRAWTEQDAIEQANQRLAKYLAKKGQP